MTYILKPEYHREDWQGMVSYLQLSSDTVVMLDAVSRPLWYYDRGRHEVVDYGQATTVIDDSAIWLVKYGQPIFEPDNQTERLLLKFGFEVVYEKHFRGDLIVKRLVKPSGVGV